MYCNKCGKKLEDESLFCNYCGEKIVLVEEENSLANEDEWEEKKGFARFVVISFAILCAVVMIMLLIANSLPKDNDDTLSRPVSVSREDLYVTYRKIDNIFTHDEYYMSLQVQEKIENLKLKVSFLSSKGKVLKTETLYIGKVVPGNEYSYKLSLNGMDPSDLDSIQKFSYIIVDGKIID